MSEPGTSPSSGAPLPAAVRSRTAQVDGLLTHWLEAGPNGNPAVVLLHGGAHGEDAHGAWGPLLEPLAEAGHRVLAPDLLGFGATAKVRDFADLPGRYVDHLARWLGHLGVDSPACVVGLSMGGSVLLRDLCSPAPRLGARRAVLVSAGGAPIAPAVRARLFDYDGTVEGMRDQLRLAFADPVAAEDRELVSRRHAVSRVPGAWETVTSFLSRPPWATPPPPGDPVPYERVAVPVLLVVGGRDALKEPGWHEPVLDRLPDARLHRSPDAGHLPQLEDAPGVLAALLSFLADEPAGHASTPQTTEAAT